MRRSHRYLEWISFFPVLQKPTDILLCRDANSHNIDIEPEVRCLGTTEKAVVNAVCQIGIAYDPRGSRIIAFNLYYIISYEYVCVRYICPQLAILLKMKYNILSVGTCRTNRKG